MRYGEGGVVIVVWFLWCWVSVIIRVPFWLVLPLFILRAGWFTGNFLVIGCGVCLTIVVFFNFHGVIHHMFAFLVRGDCERSDGVDHDYP